MSSRTRAAVIARIAGDVLSLPATLARRVAVDGVDGAGTTFLADELAEELAGRGATVIRASVDDFHHPREVRYRLGRTSPAGFFRDSYDYGKLVLLLLEPTRARGIWTLRQPGVRRPERGSRRTRGRAGYARRDPRPGRHLPPPRRADGPLGLLDLARSAVSRLDSARGPSGARDTVTPIQVRSRTDATSTARASTSPNAAPSRVRRS